MTCSDFVERFSEHLDGTGSEEHLREADEHLAQCASCRRYREVVERGAELLRTLPVPEISEDFGPRLQHRLYHADVMAGLEGGANSAAPALTVLGMALVLTVVAWVPTLRSSAPEVRLPAIEVSLPPMPLRYRSAPAFPFNPLRSLRSVRPAGLWDDAPGVFSKYSLMAQRYRSSSVEHAGLDQDR
jgi:Putative zinc-finger